MKTVTIGTRTFPITALPIKAAREWRRLAKGRVHGILSLVENLAHQQVSSVNDLLAMVQQGMMQLMDAPDDIYDLVVAYIPSIKEYQEEIETTATDVQIFDAFWAIVQVVYPFGRMFQGLGLGSKLSMNGPTGRTEPGTVLNYPSPNGDETTSMSSSSTGSPMPTPDATSGLPD